MISPLHFSEHQAWVACTLNTQPIRTLADGDFDCYGIVEVATGIILGTQFAPAAVDLPGLAAQHLLDEALSQQGVAPETLFLPDDRSWTTLVAAATTREIAVVEIPEAQLLEIIDPPRKSLEAYLKSSPR